MVPQGLFIDDHGVIVSDIWIFDRFQSYFVTCSNLFFVVMWFQCVFVSARQKISASFLCVKSHITSQVCVVVDSPILPEFLLQNACR